MPSFRGVEKDDVLKTIESGLSLLEKHSVGSQCDTLINQIRNGQDGQPSQLDQIKAATDDKALTQAVQHGGASYIFSRLYDVLKYHAHNNTDGHGRQTYEDLCALGINGVAMTMEYNELDRQSDDWINKPHRRLKSAFNKISGRLTGRYAQIENAILEKFPLKEYGILSEALNKGEINWSDDSLNKTREKMEGVLAPFYELGEVNRTGIGIICREKELQGVIFSGTERVAQAVAAAFPKEKIIDADGNQVVPSCAPKSKTKAKPKR